LLFADPMSRWDVELGYSGSQTRAENAPSRKVSLGCDRYNR